MSINVKLKLAAAGLALGLSAGSAHAVAVSLELNLLTDTSGSVSSSDFGLMAEGYARAFEDATVRDKIFNSSTGSIAVAVGQFSSAYNGLAVNWMEINDNASAQAVADAIRAMSRLAGGSTNLTDGLIGAAASFINNGFEGERQVIDLAGDGSKSVNCSESDPTCIPLQNARDSVIAGGVDAINALFIDNGGFFCEAGPPACTIDSILYGETNVISGSGSFVTAANDFNAFEVAIRNKILREVGPPPIPVPAGLPLLVSAFVGFGLMRRRRAKA